MPSHFDQATPLKDIIIDLFANGQWQEGLHLEFKSAKGGFPKDAWCTYSAFANTEGGYLVLGVEDDGTISGVKSPEKLHKSLTDTVNNPNKVSFNLLTDQDIAIIPMEEATIFAVRVRRAGTDKRPIYLNGNEHRCYHRNHSADQLCSTEMRYQMIRDKRMSLYESRILPHTSLDDLDLESLNQFRHLMNLNREGHPWLEESHLGLLEKLLAYGKDRDTGMEGLTLAGLLMFGSDQSIRELLPMYKVEFYERDDSDDVLTRWLDRIYIDGTWAPNLFQFFKRVRLKLESGLKRPFALDENMIRQDVGPAHVAVREALANAIIHADYQAETGVRIEKTPHGISLRNAGSLLLSKDYIFHGGYSICRNPAIQNMFSLIGVSEKAGSGVDKIVKGWLHEYVVIPELSDSFEPACVTWSLPYAGICDARDLNHIKAVLGAELFNQLNQWQKILLVLIPSKNWISRNELAELLPIHPSDVSKHLSKFIQDGYIISEGNSNAKRYRRHESLVPSDNQSEFDIQQKPIQVGEQLLASLDEDLQARIREYRKKKRQAKELTESLILAIAQDRWTSIGDFARLLERKPSAIRRDFIQPLQRYHFLEAQHDQKSHPKQAYRSIPK